MDFANNPFKLNMKSLVIVFILVTILSFLLPAVWYGLESSPQQTNFRIPKNQSNDYWLFAKWCDEVKSDEIIILGDSAIWGHYVDAENTLSANLNDALKKDIFKNGGVSGLHSLGLNGLINNYINLNGRKVVLQFAPLWITSPIQDVSVKGKKGTLNHPTLLPQLVGTPKGYEPEFEERISVFFQQKLPVLRLSEHLSHKYFKSDGFYEWLIKHPGKNPLEIDDESLKEEEFEKDKAPWSGPLQNFEWVELEKSFQWLAFKESFETLKKNNDVFILLGPFNEFILTKESLAKYESIKAEISKYLEANSISYVWADKLKSDLFGDASHPLEEGYKVLAEKLIKNKKFSKWYLNK